MKLRKIKTGGESYVLTIMKQLVKIKGWKDGDEIEEILDQKTGDLILRKLEKPK